MGYVRTWIDASGTSNAGGTNFTVGANTTVGDTLVLAIGTSGGDSLSLPPLDSKGNGWDIVVNTAGSGRNLAMAVCVLTSALTTSDTITLYSAVGGNAQRCFGTEYTLIHNTATNPDKVNSGQSSSTTSLSTGSTGTLSQANEISVSAVTTGNTKTYTAPGGYTVHNSSGAMAQGELTVASTSAISATWSWTGAVSAGVGIVTLPLASAPTVIASAPTSVTSSSATGHGNVTSDGGNPVTARGFVWAQHASPTLLDSHVTVAGTTGSYTGSLTGLSPGQSYAYAAYATNGVDTTYSTDQDFVTPANAPTVTTSAATSITTSSAIGNGNVTSDGGGTITERGFVWSTSSNPTTSDNKVTAAGTTGSYTATMSPLGAGTLYHYRAYATNSTGTSYGADTTFTADSETLSLLGVG